jgi:type III restriction enzyme
MIGQLWEERSNGKCLFIMPKGKDLQAIKSKIASV